MFSPSSQGKRYSKLEPHTNGWKSACPDQLEHHGGSRESAGDSLKKLLSPLGAKLRSPAGYRRLSEAGAVVLGNASTSKAVAEEDGVLSEEVASAAAALAAFVGAADSDSAQPSQVHRGSGSFSKKPRPPRLHQLSDSDHAEDEFGCLERRAQQLVVASAPVRSAQQTFELAQECTALRSPISRSAQSLKHQLEVLTSVVGGDSSHPASPAHRELGRVLLSLRHEDQLLSPLAMFSTATPKSTPAATPKALTPTEVPSSSHAPGSPAAAEALLAARSRLAIAAATAKTVIGATTPKAMAFRQTLHTQPARGTDD